MLEQQAAETVDTAIEIQAKGRVIPETEQTDSEALQRDLEEFTEMIRLRYRTHIKISEVPSEEELAKLTSSEENDRAQVEAYVEEVIEKQVIFNKTGEQRGKTAETDNTIT